MHTLLRVVFFVFFSLAMLQTLALADWIRGKLDRIDWKNNAIIVRESDPVRDHGLKVTVVVKKDTSFEGIKSMRELKIGQMLEVDYYGDELTGIKLARTVKYLPLFVKDMKKRK